MTPSKTKKSTTRRTRPAAKKAAPRGSKKALAPKKPKKPARVEPVAPPPENPKAKALAERIAALTLDKKAKDVLLLDVRGKTSYADYFVIASGESERQVSAMAEHVETTLRGEGVRPVGSEGYDTGHWVLLDYGEVVAHLFFTEVRAFYDLEGLWSDATRERVA